MIYQGALPEKHSSAAVRRVCDLTAAIASTGANSSLFSPSHYGNNTPMYSVDFCHQYLGTPGKNPSFKSRSTFWRGVFDSAVRTNADSVCFYNTTIDSLPTIRRLRNKSIHVTYFLCDLFSTVRKSLSRRLFHLVGEIMIPRSACLNVAISSGIRDRLHKTASSVKTVVVPGLYDEREFRKLAKNNENFRMENGIKVDELIFIYSGSHSKIKGLDILFAAFAELVQSNPNMRLVVTGGLSKGADTTDVVELREKYKLSGRVSTPGFLTDETLRNWLEMADVAVCPHLDHEFASYAFPTKIAEYAAMGKPTISTEVGDVGRYLIDGQSAWLCKPNDVTSMCDAMKRSMDRDARLSIGEAAKEVAEKSFSRQSAGVLLRKSIESTSTRI
jgi:glycosyltransferase involved in cell wall biosynthesis